MFSPHFHSFFFLRCSRKRKRPLARTHGNRSRPFENPYEEATPAKNNKVDTSRCRQGSPARLREALPSSSHPWHRSSILVLEDTENRCFPTDSPGGTETAVRTVRGSCYTRTMRLGDRVERAWVLATLVADRGSRKVLRRAVGKVFAFSCCSFVFRGGRDCNARLGVCEPSRVIRGGRGGA